MGRGLREAREGVLRKASANMLSGKQ